MPGLVSTGMGDRVRGSTPGAGTIAVCNQPPRSTQPGHPAVGRRNLAIAMATVREENSECCVTVAPVTRTAGILT